MNNKEKCTTENGEGWHSTANLDVERQVMGFEPTLGQYNDPS